MDIDWCLACNKQFAAPHSSYCSPECMSYEDVAGTTSPAPHAVNSRLRARLEGPSPVGWSRKVREPRSRSMSRAPRPSNTPRAPPIVHFEGSDRAPSPESEVAWSLPAAGGAKRLVGSRWMGKDYEGIKCWASGVRGFPDDMSEDFSDDDSDVFYTEPATQPIFPIALHAPSLALSASRPAPPTLSTQLSITPKLFSLRTCDDTASLATPVTDVCLVDTHASAAVSTPNQAALHLRRLVKNKVPHSPSTINTLKEHPRPAPVPFVTPKSPSAEPVWIAPTTQTPIRLASQRGRDWGGLYDDCEKGPLPSDCIGSFGTASSWSRGRARQRAYTDNVFRR